MFDERLKAGPQVKFIHIVNLMLTEWDKNKRVLDAIAVSDLTTTFKNWPEQVLPFFNELADMHKILMKDYESFVLIVAPRSDNTTISIAIRYQYAVYKHALERMILTMSKFVNINRRFNSDDNMKFKSMMLLFKDQPLETLADLPHVLFTELSLRQHLYRILPNSQRPRSKQSNHLDSRINYMMSETYTLPDHVIVHDNKGLDEIFKICAAYASLPVVPPDVSGMLITTHGFDRYVELKLHEPGPDNRRNVRSVTDKRVCVICKLDSIIVGFTDIVEQDKSVKCQCVTILEAESEEYLDNLTFMRANQSVRMLMLNGYSSNERCFRTKFDEFVSVVGQSKIHDV